MAFVGVVLLTALVYVLVATLFGLVRAWVRGRYMLDRRAGFLPLHVACAGTSLFLRLALAGWLALLAREHAGGTWWIWPACLLGLIALWLVNSWEVEFDVNLPFTVNLPVLGLLVVAYLVFCVAPSAPRALFGWLHDPVAGTLRGMGGWLALALAWATPLTFLAYSRHRPRRP